MNTAEYVSAVVYPGAMLLLPERMNTPEAKAQTLAHGFQESGFTARVQKNNGPAHGLWQFEEGNERTRAGVTGVLLHPSTKPIVDQLLPTLLVKSWEVHDAIIYHDVLACVFARLLLWTHPKALPGHGQSKAAWSYYLDTWRPGYPRPETWDENYARAWAMVTR